MSLVKGSREVIVLAAGKGTRMNSVLPKVLHRVSGLTLLERTIRAVAEIEPQKIILVVGYGRELVEKELAETAKRYPEIEIVTVHQSEQNGTGHAAQVGLGEISESASTVLIVPGDTPLLSGEVLLGLSESFEKSESELTLLSALEDDPSGFGRVLRGSDGRVRCIVEERDCSEEQALINEVNVSLYASTPSFYRDALSSLRTDNSQAEYYLTDIVGFAVTHQRAVEAHVLDNPHLARGANTRFELSELEAIERRERNKQLMEAGVSFEDPARSYIDTDVVIGADSFVGAGVPLQGNTEVGVGVVLEGDTIIRNSRIGAESRIKLGCMIDSSELGPHCQIGPFAHLRPQSVLHQGVKIGNFVETKKAEIQEAAKVNHLSYIGDAEIGQQSNIGAGTITCNYDGERKHLTRVGERCFIGSNTALVAPVEVGDGAVVGAGSTITGNVPGGALGIARVKQKNINDWVMRKKEAPKTADD